MEGDEVRLVRKPFYVMARRVTPENMDDVAAWCRGKVEVDPNDGAKYIQVPVTTARKEVKRRAYVGEWVVRADAGFRAYLHENLFRTFQYEK